MAAPSGRAVRVGYAARDHGWTEGIDVVFGAFFLFFLVFVVGGLALLVYALVDVIRMPNDASFKAGTQLIWILVILLAQGIGAIVYLVVGRPPGGATGARQRLEQDQHPPPRPV